MAELVIYERGRPESAARVWPAAEGAGAVVQEARDYIFELRQTQNPDSVDLYLDEVPVLALRSPDPTTARWEWQPGFYAGSVEAVLQWPGRRESFEIVTDPDLRKLTRADFDTMVREILEDTFALFSLSSFRTGIAAGPGSQAPPLARLEFIRSRIEELEQVVRQIDARPQRVLRASFRKIPLHRAQNLTGPELLRSMRTGRLLPRPQGVLPESVPDLLPAQVWKTRKSHGLNIREHQDIKACLRSWASWLEVVAASLSRSTIPDADLQKAQRNWATRSRRLARRLRDLLQLPLFREVADRTAPVALTPIYRRVAAYRRFFEIHRDMNLGIARIMGAHLQMPLGRTFDLYEIWCFLRLLRVATHRFGITDEEASRLFDSLGSGGLTLSVGSVRIALKMGYSFAFQKSYREYWSTPDLTGSFSRPMRPDVSVTVPGASGGAPLAGDTGLLVVLDAKYRINQQLDDAITSLHTYRDALVHADQADATRRVVVAAYLLTPHLPAVDTRWKSTRMPDRLFHPGYRTVFRFGAISMKPGQSLAQIEASLETILSDAGLPVLGGSPASPDAAGSPAPSTSAPAAPDASGLES